MFAVVSEALKELVYIELKRRYSNARGLYATISLTQSSLRCCANFWSQIHLYDHLHHCRSRDQTATTKYIRWTVAYQPPLRPPPSPPPPRTYLSVNSTFNQTAYSSTQSVLEPPSADSTFLPKASCALLFSASQTTDHTNVFGSGCLVSTPTVMQVIIKMNL